MSKPPPAGEAAPGTLFAGLNICLSNEGQRFNQHGEDRGMGEAMNAVISNGGQWCNVKKGGCDVLVATKWAAQRIDFKRAVQYSLPIVNENWLWDSIKEKQLLDYSDYTLAPDPDAPPPPEKKPVSKQTQAQAKGLTEAALPLYLLNGDRFWQVEVVNEAPKVVYRFGKVGKAGSTREEPYMTRDECVKKALAQARAKMRAVGGVTCRQLQQVRVACTWLGDRVGSVQG
eukprot:m.298852 g.298852  ORF g.298852 m.298852 type:complete len:229 (-) comp19541_c0_seq3:530-1216(-)